MLDYSLGCSRVFQLNLLSGVSVGVTSQSASACRAAGPHRHAVPFDLVSGSQLEATSQSTAREHIALPLFVALSHTKLPPKLFGINTVQTTVRMPCCRSMMLRPCQAAGYQCPGPCVLRCEWDVKKRSSVSHQHRSAMINERRAEPILSTNIVPFPCPCLLFLYCQTVAQQPSLSSKTTECGQDSHPWQSRLPHLRTKCRPAALLMFSRPLT